MRSRTPSPTASSPISRRSRAPHRLSLRLRLQLQRRHAHAPQPARAATARRSAAADAIEHVVVLMLENRSFDHMVGSLRDVFPTLEGIDPARPGRNLDPADPGHPYLQQPTLVTALAKDPKHELANVRYQLDSALGRCGGFVDDFKRAYNLPRALTKEVMGYYEFGHLPALHRLASEFTICDHWFSSVPGPTWT